MKNKKMSQAEEKANAAESIKRHLAESVKKHLPRSEVLFESQRPFDEDYGYSKSNPIMTSCIPDSYGYLSVLRTEAGESFTYERLGSLDVSLCGTDGVIVDSYQLYLNGQKHSVIYICPYGENSGYAPRGMKLDI